MAGQGQLTETQARALQILVNTQERFPGLIDQYVSGMRAAQAAAAAATTASAPQRASETIVTNADECVVCFVTKQCCRDVLDQKIRQLTAEDAQKLKHSVCVDHSSKAPGTKASKAMVEGEVKAARDIIDLYMQPLQ